MSPIYSYMCNSCGHEFDEIRSYDPEEDKIECPHCETMTAEKLPSMVGGIQGDFGNGSTRSRRVRKGTTKTLNFSKRETGK